MHHLTVKEGRSLEVAQTMWQEAKYDSKVPKQSTDRGERIGLRVGSVALGASNMTRALDVRTEGYIKDHEEHTR